MTVPDVDVIVGGGGPGGSAAAIQCAQAGLRMVLAERELFPRAHPGEALHPGTESLLRQVGVVEEVLAADFPQHEGHWVQWGGATSICAVRTRWQRPLARFASMASCF